MTKFNKGLAAALAVAGVMVGGVAYATIPGPDGVIHALLPREAGTTSPGQR